MTLAKRMKKQMSELGLTQEAVANRADISQGMVYKLLSGKAKSTSKLYNLRMPWNVISSGWQRVKFRRHRIK